MNIIQLRKFTIKLLNSLGFNVLMFNDKVLYVYVAKTDSIKQVNYLGLFDVREFIEANG